MTHNQSIDLGAMIEGIGRWVLTESPSRDAAAVNRMVDLVQADAADLNVAIERIPGQSGLGDLLVMRSVEARQSPGILILSHVDTVHPMGTITSSLPFRREGDRLYGPGIYDMKGGAYLALEAFREVLRAGTVRLPITFVFTPDEEIGSPTSRGLIEDEARLARYVLVTEPARDGGKIVTSRKGVGGFELKITGVPAHAGLDHEKGHSAIKEMARQVLAIEGLTDYQRGVTACVGTISGGTGKNVVPHHCQASIDLRVPDLAAGDEFEQRIRGLRPHDPAVKLEVSGGITRSAFVKSAAVDALFHHAQALAKDIGFDLQDSAMAGGVSDANLTAALGVPTLDGLGIDGDGAHTDWEHGYVSSIEPRTLLMGRLLETLQ